MCISILRNEAVLIPWRRKLRKSDNFYWLLEGLFTIVVHINLRMALSPCFLSIYRHTIEMLIPPPALRSPKPLSKLLLSHIPKRLQTLPTSLFRFFPNVYGSAFIREVLTPHKGAPPQGNYKLHKQTLVLQIDDIQILLSKTVGFKSNQVPILVTASSNVSFWILQSGPKVFPASVGGNTESVHCKGILFLLESVGIHYN